MTIKHLRSLASLCGVPAVAASYMPQTPKAFLQACNEALSDPANAIQLDQWLIATKQKSFGQVRRAKQKVKVVVTPNRQALISHFWRPLVAQLRAYTQSTKGGASRAAEFIGTSPAQIHRWTCPVCEHDQEPSYSLGKAVEIFLSTL